MVEPHNETEFDHRQDADAVAYLVGAELSERRKRAKKTLPDAAKALGCSVAKVHNMEAGRNQQRPDEVQTLLRLYRASQVDIDRLCALASSASGKTWWAPWTDVVPDWLRTFVGLEGLADSAQIYAPLILPALLQTAEYSHAATEGDPHVRPDHNDRVVALRQERQRRVTATESPLKLEVFIEEMALLRPIGTPDVMADQYRHLLDLGQLPTVSLRLLPTSLGRHDAIAGRFTVLTFERSSPIAYIEMLHGAIYVQDQAQVGGYTRAVDHLRGRALDATSTIEVIRKRLTI